MSSPLRRATMTLGCVTLIALVVFILTNSPRHTGVAHASTVSPALHARCTRHVTTTSFTAVMAASRAGGPHRLCLSPGDYGSFPASGGGSPVTILPDTSAGATESNVTLHPHFDGVSHLTISGVTIADGTITGSSHDITLTHSNFTSQLFLDDTSMNNANIVLSYDTFPATAADCLHGYEGRIEISDSGHGPTPDGIIIEHSRIGPGGDCDGVQSGGYGVKILDNIFDDFHYVGDVHVDGVQLYGARYNVIDGNFFHNVPDAIEAPDPSNDHQDIENNLMVLDASGRAEVLQLYSDTGSIIRHNTLPDGRCSYDQPCGIISLGSKAGAPGSSGTTIVDNIASQISVDAAGGPVSYSENYNLFTEGHGQGAHDLHGRPTYVGGPCATRQTLPPGPCDTRVEFLLTPRSRGARAADDGRNMGITG